MNISNRLYRAGTKIPARCFFHEHKAGKKAAKNHFHIPDYRDFLPLIFLQKYRKYRTSSKVKPPVLQKISTPSG
jgi:hypothetical protein